MIHCRDAHADAQKVLAEFFPTTSIAVACPQPVGVIHCFAGTWEDAQTYLQHGFYLGIDGPLTYPSAKLLKENVLRLPLERIVLETDSPYLRRRRAHRGQRNETRASPHRGFRGDVASIKYKTLDQVAPVRPL